jgi:hypothetical protein
MGLKSVEAPLAVGWSEEDDPLIGPSLSALGEAGSLIETVSLRASEEFLIQ